MNGLEELMLEEVDQFRVCLKRAGFTAKMVRKIISAPKNELAKYLFKTLTDYPRFALVHGYFTSTAKQIALVRTWNDERGWGITEEAFSEAARTIPKWPKEKLVAVVLVPYLPEKACEDGTMMGSVERTFQELWACVAAQHEKHSRWKRYDKAGKFLGIRKGSDHAPGLRWEVIDLGCRRGEDPYHFPEVSPPQPHAGVLAAAALHPEWIASMKDCSAPKVRISGYCISRRGHEATGMYSPDLVYARNDHGLSSICTLRLGDGIKNDSSYETTWAAPAFYKGRVNGKTR